MRKTLLFVTMVAGVMGMTHCSGDDASPADAGAADSGTEASRATGTGGKAGTGGSAADSGKIDGSLGGSAGSSAGGSSGTGGLDDGSVGTGGDLTGTGGGNVGTGGVDGGPVGTGGADGGTGGGSAVDANADGPACPAQHPNGAACTQFSGRTCGDCQCPATGTRVWECPGGSDAGDAEAGIQCPAPAQLSDLDDCTGFSAGASCQGSVTTPCRCRRDSKWWCLSDAFVSDSACPTVVPSTDQACGSAMTCPGYLVGGNAMRACTCTAPSGYQLRRWDCVDVPLTDAGEDAADATDATEGTDATDAAEDVGNDGDNDAEVDSGEQ